MEYKWVQAACLILSQRGLHNAYWFWHPSIIYIRASVTDPMRIPSLHILPSIRPWGCIPHMRNCPNIISLIPIHTRSPLQMPLKSRKDQTASWNVMKNDKTHSLEQYNQGKYNVELRIASLTHSIYTCSPTSTYSFKPRRRHRMETFSMLLVLCAGNSPVTGEFPSQRPVMRSFAVFFDLRLYKRLSKQSRCWWFETHRVHCDVTVMSYFGSFPV